MNPILAIDYGKIRTGIAITDNLQMIASALTTVETNQLFEYLTRCINENKVEILVIGLSKNLKNELNEIEMEISVFIQKIKTVFPTLKIERVDERFTSKMASVSIFESGLNKKNRKNKALIDQVSATIILQSYLATKL